MNLDSFTVIHLVFALVLLGYIVYTNFPSSSVPLKIQRDKRLTNEPTNCTDWEWDYGCPLNRYGGRTVIWGRDCKGSCNSTICCKPPENNPPDKGGGTMEDGR